MNARRFYRSAAALCLAFVFAMAAAACRDLSGDRAEALVKRYNGKLIEAYKLGDERIVDGLVGDEEGKKLTGLIGVKTDMGINLDSVLTRFRVTGIARPRNGDVEVMTEERWHYRDRRIGSGETVGPESDDHYFMRYSLTRKNDSWIVARVAFEQPPTVGRTTALVQASPKVFHGSVAPPREPAPASGKGRTP